MGEDIQSADQEHVTLVKLDPTTPNNTSTGKHTAVSRLGQTALSFQASSLGGIALAVAGPFL